METEHGGAKDLFKLIIHSPALLVSVLVGLALIIYFLVKYGPSSTQNTGGGTGTVGVDSAPTAVVVPQNSSVYNITRTTPPAPDTSTPPVNTAPSPGSPVPTALASDLATIRSKGSIPTVATYDAKNTGVPIRSQAGSGNDVIGSAGFGSQVQVTGPAIQGSSSNLPGTQNGTNLYYPVTVNGKTGYVSAFDITNSYQQ